MKLTRSNPPLAPDPATGGVAPAKPAKGSPDRAAPPPPTRRALSPEDQAVLALDTVPPPASGDAYGAATAIFEAPVEMLERLREISAAAEAEAAKLATETPAERVRPRDPTEQKVPTVPRMEVARRLAEDEQRAEDEEDANAQTMFVMRRSTDETRPPAVDEPRVPEAASGPRESGAPKSYVAPLGGEAPDGSPLIVVVAVVAAAIIVALASWR